MTISDFIGTLAENPVFGGGAGLAIMAASFGALRKGGQKVAQELLRRSTASLEVTIQQPVVFNYVGHYITQQPSMRNHATIVSNMVMEDGLHREQFRSQPAPGIHYTKFQGRWIRIERNRANALGDKPFESIKVATYNTPKLDGRTVLDNFLQHAKTQYDKTLDSRMILLEPDTSSWRQFGNPIKKRSIESVVLDGNLSAEIVGDMKQFLSSSEWYVSKGISHQRGYLLYGPPGTGKTSFIKAVAGELGFNVAILSVSSWHMDDTRLLTLFANLPPNTLLLLEDIDAAMPVNRAKMPNDEKFKGMMGPVTLSGILNALDGIVGGDGRIVCMTTNHIERLDPALLRPGRCDKKVLLDNASDAQIERIYLSYFPGEEETATRFVADMRLWASTQDPPIISPATVQNVLMVNRDNPRFFEIHHDSENSKPQNEKQESSTS